MRHITLSRELILKVTLIFIIAGIAFLGCESKKPIKIGFIGGTSGRVADLGISGLDAVQLAVEQCNIRGGINGREIRLIIKDDQQDPAVARQAAQDLISEEVAAIIGPMTSDMGMVVAPILNDAKILNVSPTSPSMLCSVSSRELSAYP